MTDHRHRTYTMAVCSMVIAVLVALLLGTLINALEAPRNIKMDIPAPSAEPTNNV